MTRSLTYKDAGVDIDAGNELVRRISAACKQTHRPELLAGVGGFAALTELPTGYAQPVLVTGTDGVGTKLALAIAYRRHDHVGEDLVAMCANDVLCTGAEPFLFLDYYATGKLDVDVAARVINGIAAGCKLAGCALVGGETAEMPGFYEGGEYDLAGFCVGVVEKQRIVSGNAIAPGDILVALASSGPHSNGFALIRRILTDQGAPAAQLLDALLAPTRIYAKAVLATQAALRSRTAPVDGPAISGMAHITGGGLLENLPRMFAPGATLRACVNLDSWQRPEVFSFLQQAGNITEEEMLKTFNCGVGFVIALKPWAVQPGTEILRDAGEAPVVIGSVVPADHTPGVGERLIF